MYHITYVFCKDIYFPLFYKNTIHYVLNSQKCIKYEQVNNLRFGICQWQDTHSEFPKFISLPFIVRQKVIILELAPTFSFAGWAGGHRNGDHTEIQ